MNLPSSDLRGPKTIFRWEIQLPFGLLCVAGYWFFLETEGRSEPVLAGLGYAATAAAIYEFWLRRRVKSKHRSQRER